MLTVGIGLVDVGKSRLNFLNSLAGAVLKHAIKRIKNKIEKPIHNFKKTSHIFGDWFSCSFIWKKNHYRILIFRYVSLSRVCSILENRRIFMHEKSTSFCTFYSEKKKLNKFSKKLKEKLTLKCESATLNIDDISTRYK